MFWSILFYSDTSQVTVNQHLFAATLFCDLLVILIKKNGCHFLQDIFCSGLFINTKLTTELPPLSLCSGEDLGVVPHPVVDVGPQGVHPHQWPGQVLEAPRGGSVQHLVGVLIDLVVLSLSPRHFLFQCLQSQSHWNYSLPCKKEIQTIWIQSILKGYFNFIHKVIEYLIQSPPLSTSNLPQPHPLKKIKLHWPWTFYFSPGGRSDCPLHSLC